jgi:carbon catabolite-derepressing protein kinase
VESAFEGWKNDWGGRPPQPVSRKIMPKKELVAQEKAALGLFFVETRARYGDVMVSGL